MKKLIFLLLAVSNIVYAQYDDYEIDALLHPKYQGITITVGGEQADVHGFSNRAIQLAVNALPAEGGIVKLNDGIFELKDAVHLRSHVNLIGSGPATVLKRANGFKSRLMDDADILVSTLEPTKFMEPLKESHWMSMNELSRATRWPISTFPVSINRVGVPEPIK